MSNRDIPSKSPDEFEHKNLSVIGEQDKGKSTRKSGRIRKSTQLSADTDDAQKEENIPLLDEQVLTDEDLLADIRRSLMEEENTKQEEKKNGIFQRMVRIIKPDKASSIENSNEEDAGLGEVPVVAHVQEITTTTAALSSVERSLVIAEDDTTFTPDAGSKNFESAEQDIVALVLGIESEELIPEKKQDELIYHAQPEKIAGSGVLRPKLEKVRVDESFETIREVALEDYSDTPFQSEDIPVVSWRQRIKIVFKGMKPFDKVLFFGGLSVMLIGGLIGFGLTAFNAQASEIAAVPTQDVPVPVRVALPGGWEFNLTVGKVENARWSPRTAEWLEGTELCKWVALPWSMQLEAVVRTFKLNDSVELTMSNADQLKYKVQSIQNIPVDQIDTLDKKRSCLLLILVNEDADTRWVITAIP